MRSRSRKFDCYCAVYVVAVIGGNVTRSTLKALTELINVKLTKDVNICLFTFAAFVGQGFSYGDRLLERKASMEERWMDDGLSTLWRGEISLLLPSGDFALRDFLAHTNRKSRNETMQYNYVTIDY